MHLIRRRKFISPVFRGQWLLLKVAAARFFPSRLPAWQKMRPTNSPERPTVRLAYLRVGRPVRHFLCNFSTLATM